MFSCFLVNMLSKVQWFCLQAGSDGDTRPKKRTRLAKRNMSYTREQRAEIGRWAAEKGSTSASRKFKVPNSTVRSIKKKYLEALENGQVRPTMVIISWKGSLKYYRKINHSTV